jgi:putative membrane protein
MVKDHEEDVKTFQREADKGKDEQIKAFASETLPMIQGHLEKIKAIQSKMGV